MGLLDRILRRGRGGSARSTSSDDAHWQQLAIQAADDRDDDENGNDDGGDGGNGGNGGDGGSGGGNGGGSE